MEKVLKDGKLYSLIEFRDRIYEDLDLSKSDLTTLLCAMLIASIGLNMNSIPAIIGAMLISPLMTPILGVGFALAILDTKLLKKSFNSSCSKPFSLYTLFFTFTNFLCKYGNYY